MRIRPFALCAVLGATPMLSLVSGCELVFGVGADPDGDDAGETDPGNGDDDAGQSEETPVEDPGAGYLATPDGDGDACGSEAGSTSVACDNEDVCIVAEQNVCGPAVYDRYTAYNSAMGPECGTVDIGASSACAAGDFCHSPEEHACVSSTDGSFYQATDSTGPTCGVYRSPVRCEPSDLCVWAADKLCAVAEDGSYTSYIAAMGPECGTSVVGVSAVWCEIGDVCDSVEENLCRTSDGSTVAATQQEADEEPGDYCGLVSVESIVRCEPGDLCVEPEKRLCR